MKKFITATVIAACIALCAAVWPQSKVVKEKHLSRPQHPPCAPQKRRLWNSKRKSKPRQRQRKKKKQFRQQKHPWKSSLNQSLRPAKYPQLTRSIRHQNRKWPRKQHRNLHPSRLTSYSQVNPRR